MTVVHELKIWPGPFLAVERGEKLHEIRVDEWVTVAPDAVAVVCSRGKRWPRCSVPSCDRPAPFLCDWSVKRKKSGTCDAKLCEGHRANVAEDRDLCSPHFKLHEQQPRSLEAELAELERTDPRVRAAAEQLDLVARELVRRSGGDER